MLSIVEITLSMMQEIVMRQKNKKLVFFNKETLRYRSQQIKSIGICVIKVKSFIIKMYTLI